HLLGEIPLAVEHYEKFVAVARKMGANPQMVSGFEKTAQHLKASLTPTFIDAQMPTVYTEQTLQAGLQERLTRAELEMVVNPVASSPEIGRWARELTQGASGDFDKAKAIFDGLMQRIQLGKGFGSRTAQEVFAAWRDPSESFNCQQLTYLYLALAREVGIKAFVVRVVRDYQGKLVFHVCAIVFVEGKALLVDPTYRWFGVPHKEFAVLDDVRTVAFHLSQITSQ
ncbi:MAG: transglutaminase domain-containing protein, partial [Planctomycetes bacterium]|nr:transglutaminase domain-containing protein [Planctomycetota bacterium]